MERLASPHVWRVWRVIGHYVSHTRACRHPDSCCRKPTLVAEHGVLSCSSQGVHREFTVHSSQGGVLSCSSQFTVHREFTGRRVELHFTRTLPCCSVDPGRLELGS
eukprot:351362-Chlamydomonas_euryale.AAC.3